VITQNRLLGIIVLLAGLAAGYFASRRVHLFHERSLSSLPDYYSREGMPEASQANLSILYDQSKERFQDLLSQGQDTIWEAARRRQVLVESRDRVTTDPQAYEQLILQAEGEVDLLRLEDYYRQFYLFYYRWLDTGDAQSAVKFRLSLGQFKATLDYILEKQGKDPALTVREIEDLRTFIQIAEQSSRTIRWARVVVVVLLFLLVMGIPRLIRDSGYKRFAGSLYFDSLFRPVLISSLNKWHSIHRMAIVLLVIYLFGLVVFSSFISWRIPVIIGTLGLIPVIMLVWMSGKPRNLSALLISFMAPKMLVLLLVLGVVALRGPNFFWYRLWESELFRGLFISLLFMLIFRKIHVNMILARKWSHRNRTGSAAMVWMAFGFQLLVAGALMYCFGPEESLVSLNGELLLLPESLLGFPALLLSRMMIAAGFLTASALVIFILNKRRVHEPSGRA